MNIGLSIIPGEAHSKIDHPHSRRPALKKIILFGAFSAFVTGIAIGAQATLSGRVGSQIGPLRTGLLTNIAGGVFALLGLGVYTLLPSIESGEITMRAVVLMLTSGFLGVCIVAGVSFSVQRAGVAAGMAAIILGQMLVSTFADTRGLGGADPIPMDPRRVAGLLVMAAAMYLLLPKG